MKIIIKTGVSALLVSLAACGSAGTNQSDQSPAASSQNRLQNNAAETHSATGTVEKVAAGQVTIAHGPVQTLQWPAMTMAFSAQEAALLEGVRPGDRVAFSFAESGSGYALTAISKQ